MGSKKYLFSKRKSKKYSDIDVNNFITATRIYILSQTDAVNYLITSLKSNSLWSKMQAVYPIVGGTIDTHKFNAKNPINADSAFRISFTGGVHTLNGWKGSDISSSGFTNIIPALIQNVNSNGATITIGQDGAELNIVDYLASNGSTQRTHIAVKATNLFVIRVNGTQSATVTNTDPKGVYTAQRISNTVQNGWKNGTKLINSTADGSLSTVSLRIQGDKRFQSFYVHEGLTDLEVPILRTIIDTYENMLGRKTW